MQTPVFFQPISIGDRVTFDTDEGYQAGTVNDLRRDVGNGELHAWVELDHQWPGMFRAVPLAALQSVPTRTNKQSTEVNNENVS